MENSKFDGPERMAEDIVELDSFDLIWVEHQADEICSIRVDCTQLRTVRDPEVPGDVVFRREWELSDEDDEHDAAELPDCNAVLKVSLEAEELGREEQLCSTESFLL